MARKRSGVSAARVSLQKTVDSVLIHDIKNLAFRLSALLQNMDEHFENPVFRTNMGEALADTVRRMNTMVKSYVDHQQQVILKLKLNLNDLLRMLLDSLSPGAVRHIKIETEFSEIPSIWGDSFYLQEAFMNLIQNAIEAMPEGGTLRVQTRRADTRKSPRVEIKITDTGVGISQTFIENELFQPFVTTKKNGMGLGLYTARQVFALHRGRIDVKSSPQTGTTFTILFPAETDAT